MAGSPGHATERAIFAQPDELSRLAEVPLDERVLRLGDCRRVWLVGTGSSEHAAGLGAAMLAGAGLDAHPTSAMNLARFSPPLRSDDGVIVISHTASTAFALRARAMAAEAGAALVSITGEDSGWPEAVETVPKEGSETYTLSYTAALIVLAKIAAAVGAPQAVGDDIGRVASVVRAALDRPGVGDISPPARALVLAGAGPASVTAREGALKLREAARVLAEGYDAEYLLHGSAVPLGADDHLLVLRPPEDPDGLLDAVERAAVAEGIAVTRVEEPAPLHPLLAQIPLTVRFQLLALRLAKERGQDADVAITGAWAEDRLWELGSPDAATGEIP